uniref:VP6.1 n=1 Tax=Lychas mucronatus TaxID=172552 RepID=A0A0U1S507_LYCMC|nr:VP6.1 [Lychas mucronatus]
MMTIKLIVIFTALLAVKIHQARVINEENFDVGNTNSTTTFSFYHTSTSIRCINGVCDVNISCEGNCSPTCNCNDICNNLCPNNSCKCNCKCNNNSAAIN